MTTLNFAAQVDDWVRATKAREEAVFRMSTQDVIAAVDAGVPVDTGYLKNSGEMRINAPLPVADRKPGSTGAKSEFVATIANLKAGDYVTYGYSAVYGPRVHWGFSGQDSLGREFSQAGNPWILRAVANWRGIVAANVAKAKARVK